MAYRTDPTALYQAAFSEVEPGGRLMVFGRPTMMWPNAPTPEDFFKKFGFAEVHTLDVSAYQGASHIFDLNGPEPPADLVGKYRYVLSGGTLEHVFNIVNAVKTAVALLEVGGVFSYAAPCNNWVDHGFYQISPTFAFDYFSENGFEFGASVVGLDDPVTRERLSIPLYPGEPSFVAFGHMQATHMLHAKRLADSTLDKVPTQSRYQVMHGGSWRRYRFRAGVAAIARRGKGREMVPSTSFALDARKMRFEDDCYLHPFHRKEHLASLPGRPFRSKGVVYENGEALRWIVSDPAMVGERPGSFTHFQGVVYFTASDGSDPRENGRAYTIGFPDHPMLRSVAAAKPAAAVAAED